MKISKSIMVSLIKEEYDKRINYYLGEVETKAKHNKNDGELIENAAGLKVKDRAGNVFVIDKLEQTESGEILVYLIPPGNADPNIQVQDSSTQMYDNTEKDQQNSDYFDEDYDEYLHSSVNEADDDEKKKKEKSEDKKSSNKMLTKNSDIIDPNPKAKNKKNKNFKIKASAKDISSYEEINGRVVITLKELDEDFTL